MNLFDTHCHLTAPELLPQADRVIAEALKAGVRHMVSVACTAPEISSALELCARHPEALRLAVGIHPHEAARVSDAELERISELWSRPGTAVVAAGEIGLDYHYDFSPRDVQRKVFARQLADARRSGLPVVIHCREAQPDVVRMLRDDAFEQTPVVFHCFSGTRAEAEELWSHGWWTSYTGMITFKNAVELRKICAATAADRLMFETDSPYLSPEPVRRMRPNEPQNVAHTVRFAAGLRGVSPDELADASTANAFSFFRLTPS